MPIVPSLTGLPNLSIEGVRRKPILVCPPTESKSSSCASTTTHFDHLDLSSVNTISTECKLAILI